MNFWSDFKKLKTSVGGNREKMGFEDTFGMPREEFAHITMPNKYNRRIISELEFAIRLSEVNDGKFDGCVKETLDYLLSEMKNEGALSKTACFKAEEMLMPCKSAAKEYKLILAGHAHIDMNWMWSYQETVAITLSTFRTVLNLMKQYPDFCFSQSQASVYKIVEEYDPELMEEMKQRIKEGRWEITASAWVETDKNMPNTESLLRHIKYTKDYLKESWGIDPDSLEVDFSPDTFGHSACLPELDLFGGVKYYYHCRALDGKQVLYRWKAPSGKELLMYREQNWYNSAITPHIASGLIDISKRCAGFKTGLIVYGVGDHGGGPTRRDVERALEMSEWEIYPTIKFGTFSEFFHEAEAFRDKFEVVDHELNFFARGCYTTQSRIKRGNRKSEAALTDAEALMAFAQVEAGKTYNQKKHEEAWQKVLFTHFHDILTGSCVQDSREHAMGLYSDALAYANTQYLKAATAISEITDTSSVRIDEDITATQSEGAGGGFNMSANSGVPSPERGCGKTRIFNIFNPVAVRRTEVTEITVWDWVGDMRLIAVEDISGKPLEFQLIDDSLQQYWDHKFFRILVKADIPSLGYTTVVLKEKEDASYPVYLHPDNRTNGVKDNYILENEYIRAEFDRMTCGLISLVDKETGEEYIEAGKSAGLTFIETERRTCDAWNIGRYLTVTPVRSAYSISGLSGGDLRKSFSAEYKAGKSKIKMSVSLDGNAKALRFQMEPDWNEVAGETVPLLTFDVPFAFKTDKFVYDIPAGAQYRKPMTEDVPGLQYGAAIKENGAALMLIPDSKYGYRASEDQLSVTLINTSTNPDPYPERGIHNINITLALAEDCPKLLEETATLANHSTYYVPTGSHKGVLPAEMSFVDFSADSSVISAILPSENGKDITVRFYENCGKNDRITLKFAKKPSTAECVNLEGKKLASDAKISGNEVFVSVKAYTLNALKITF